jgi:hypothetical protein
VSNRPVIIDSVSGIGERCDGCEGKCDRILEQTVMMQQIGMYAYSTGDPEIIAVAPAELEHARREHMREFREVGCTLDDVALDGLVAAVCGNEDIRDETNSFVNSPIRISTDSD